MTTLPKTADAPDTALQASLPTSLFPVRRHHYGGLFLIAIALIVVLIQPVVDHGWLRWFSDLSGKEVYNLFLAFGCVLLLFLAYTNRSRTCLWRAVAVMGVETLLTGLFKLLGLLIKNLAHTNIYIFTNMAQWLMLHVWARPSGDWSGFPSGHAAAACALAYLLTERLPRWVPVWYAFAALACWARLESGVHTPFQIIFGAIMGLTVAVVFSRWFLYRPSSDRPKV